MYPGGCSQWNNLIVFKRLFSAKQFIAYFQGAPLTVNLLITSRCNLKCHICSAKGMYKDVDELTSRQIKNFLLQISKYQPALFIGGGEPFMREDIFEILAAIKRNRLKFGLVTNGTILDYNKIDRLFNLKPEILIFSIYGKEQLHEKITGVKGLFEKICKNINYAIGKKNGTKIILNCVINQENYGQLEDVIQLGRRLGVDLVRFEHLIFLTEKEYMCHKRAWTLNFSNDEIDMTTYIANIDNRDMGAVLSVEIPRLLSKYANFVLFKPYLRKDEIKGWYRKGFIIKRDCFFIKHSLFIKHDGDIIPCQFFSNYKLGNIKKDDLVKVWNGPKRRFFSSKLKKGLLPGCIRCCKL